jgi:hypothetical protein
MKKVIVGIILIVVLFSFPIYSFSSDWVLITISEDEVFFIDSESLIIQEEYITYWTMMYNDKGQSLFKSREKLDCKKRAKQITDLTTYDSAGNIETTKSFDDKPEWMGIDSGTINDTFRMVLCDDDNKPRKDVNNFLESWQVMLQNKGIIK